MAGFEVVGLSFLTLCFTALQFAWLVDYTRIDHALL
jgi:hypothetical protein